MLDQSLVSLPESLKAPPSSLPACWWPASFCSSLLLPMGRPMARIQSKFLVLVLHGQRPECLESWETLCLGEVRSVGQVKGRFGEQVTAEHGAQLRGCVSLFACIQRMENLKWS